MLGILETISPSELLSNGYISNHNKVRRPRPKFKVSFYLYFCCFWINVAQINFENIKRKIQRIISDSCFQLKLWFNVVARAPSIPLLNFSFNLLIIHVHVVTLTFIVAFDMDPAYYQNKIISLRSNTVLNDLLFLIMHRSGPCCITITHYLDFSQSGLYIPVLFLVIFIVMFIHQLYAMRPKYIFD